MRILVAEDDLVTRMIVASTVSALGHECHEAADGEQAWERYLELLPDVLITDRTMPGLDGIELCRRVRAASPGRYIYIVLATARGGADEVLEGVEAGADDYLVKPVDSLDLRVRLIAADRVIALHRRLADTAEQLEARNAELAATARTDALTGVGNRRCFDEDLALIQSRSSRREESYCVAIADIDHFKDYNDRFGHPAGDRALRSVAAALERSCRGSDTVYRYGGEEFAIIYPDAVLPSVLASAERARAAVEAVTTDPEGEPLDGAVTISIGVAERDARAASPEAVVSAADKALYAAKSGGRNRAVSPIRWVGGGAIAGA